MTVTGPMKGKGREKQGVAPISGLVALLLCAGFLAAPASAMAFEAGSEAAAIERLQQQIQVLANEVERLRVQANERQAQQDSDRAAAALVAQKQVEDQAKERAEEKEFVLAAASAPTASGLTANGVMANTQIGGYGSIKFDATSADDINPTFTFRRFVLTADSQLAPRLRMGFELEFERFRKLELERSAEATAGGLKVEQEIEGTDESEITIEQAWFEYAVTDDFRLRAGGLLVPLGRFNLNHDDDRWTFARRPLVDRGAPALPSKAAWAELGAGFAGELSVAADAILEYQLYVVNGVALAPELEEVVQTRDGRRDKLELEGEFSVQTGTFGSDVDSGKAITGRAMLSPSLGHEIAASFYWGRYTPDWLPDESITAVAIDGLTTWGPFALEGEYVFADYGDTDEVASSFAAIALEQSQSIPSDASPDYESEIEFALNSLAKQRQGYWLEARYDTHPEWLRNSIFGHDFADPRIVYAVRAEQVWIDELLRELDFTGGTITNMEKSNHRLDRLSLGAAYRPVPSVAVQLGYEYVQVNEGSLGLVTNFMSTEDDSAHSLLLGTAFGF